MMPLQSRGADEENHSPVMGDTSPPSFHSLPALSSLHSRPAANRHPQSHLTTTTAAASPLAKAAKALAVQTFPGGLVRYWTEVSPGMSVPVMEFYSSQLRTWNWKQRLSLTGLQLHLFRDSALWKAASIEMLGTLLLTFMVLTIVTGILNHKEDYSYFPTAIAILHIPLIAFMILATAATSGGHLNPMISFSTCLAGLTEFPRMMLYIPAQVLGAIMGAYIVKHMTPSDLLEYNQLGMCSLGVDQDAAQALTMEIFCDLWVLYVAFGVALDDRQRQAMPAWLPPFVISTMIALLIYATSTVSTFSTGAIAFPTRCFAPAVAMGLVTASSFQLGPGGPVVNNAQWVYWYDLSVTVTHPWAACHSSSRPSAFTVNSRRQCLRLCVATVCSLSSGLVHFVPPASSRSSTGRCPQGLQ